jgi:hypothetical protein
MSALDIEPCSESSPMHGLSFYKVDMVGGRNGLLGLRLITSTSSTTSMDRTLNDDDYDA